MNRTKEILIAVLIILALVMFFVFNLVSSNFEEDKVLSEIKMALDERNIDVLKKHLIYEDVSKISETEIKDIIKVAEEKQIVLSDTELLVKEESKDKEKEDKDQIIRPIYFKKDGKSKLIYNDYKMVFGLYDLILELSDENISEIKVLIDGNEVKDLVKIDNKFICFGLKAGNKKLSIKFGEDFKQKIELDVALLEQGNRALNLDMYNLDRSKNLSIYEFNTPILENINVESKYINVYTNSNELDGEVFLYVNGKKTDVKLSSEYIEYGPFFQGQECKVQAKMKLNEEEYVSEEIDMVENNYGNVYLKIDYDLEEDESVEKPNMESEESDDYVGWVMRNYLNDLVKAINQGDYSLVEDSIYKGSPIEKKQKKLVEHLYSKGTKEKLLGYNINSIKKVNDSELLVNVTENHKLTYESGKEEDVSNNWLYTVKFKDDYGYIYDLKRP